jgi:starvation-inducible DNA-binding protein
MNEILTLSPINEAPKNYYPSSKEIIKELLIDHETEIVHLRNDIGIIYEKYNDVDTADFLISRMEAHETMVRLLRRATYPQSHYPMTFYN